MRSADLHKLWGAPDNSHLTAKQYSFRLPVHVAAKIAALCELFPNKTRTEIVGDLLAAALEDLIESLPHFPGREAGSGPDGEDVFEEDGPRAKFRALANKHNRELERELGNKAPADLYVQHVVSKSE